MPVDPQAVAVAQIPHFPPQGRPPEAGTCHVSDVVTHPQLGVVAVQLSSVFTVAAADALSDYLRSRLVYERYEIGEQKLTNRASRHDDAPDSPLVIHGSEPIDPLAASAFSLFSSDWFLGHLGAWVGTPVRVLRPSAPYRLDPGDYIAAHDDYAAPEHRVSVACNLTRGWAQGDGGETVVGAVENVQEYEDPDYFFPLKIWTLAPGEHSVRPKFNSALLLLLGDDRAHAVRTVVRNHRYSITTLYGTQ